LVRALTAAQTAQVNYQQYNDTRPYLDRVASVIMMFRSHRRSVGDDRPAQPIVLAVDGADLSHGNDVVVENLHLRITGPGGVALIGPSGSGKSTTTTALAGLLEPKAGVVTASGIPLSVIPSPELGHIVGMLPQDPRLLHASLRSNMVRDGVDVSDETVLAAIEAVGLTATVSGFSNGLDTPMGRDGEGFSGGEMQRLGLARLLVNQPDVWLLDEPTSALDRKNTEIATRIITDAMQRHLVVVVTHRPELLHHCGRVIYMEAGRIVDDGTLEDVAARQPFVASMIHSGAPGARASNEH
ncbi:MAG: ATP-binding cassette domain-containing protein, partial [Actinomycetes bacterium]